MSRPILPPDLAPAGRVPTAEGNVAQPDVVSFITHQLRTPLSGIRWMLELARDAESPEDARSFVSDAHASATRLITLVNDLLDVTRLEGGQPTHPPPQSRRATADDVVDGLKSLADRASHVYVDSPDGDTRDDGRDSTTIVLAEDDGFLRRAIDVALSKRGFKVVTAADGVEALEAVRAHGPALLLLDLLMPRMGGMEVLRTLRNDNNPTIRRTRVLILSNSPKELAIHDAEALGICAYWIKADLSLQELGSRVAALMTEVPA